MGVTDAETIRPAAWPSLPAPRLSWRPAPAAVPSDDVETIRPPSPEKTR